MPSGGKRTVKLDPETGLPPINPETGKPKKVGRPKVESQYEHGHSPRKGLAEEILQALGGTFRDHGKDCLCEGCLWKEDAQQPGATGRPARIHLWDRVDGKTVQPVTHSGEVSGSVTIVSSIPRPKR